jgi:hypothetical protein
MSFSTREGAILAVETAVEAFRVRKIDGPEAKVVFEAARVAAALVDKPKAEAPGASANPDMAESTGEAVMDGPFKVFPGSGGR